MLHSVPVGRYLNADIRDHAQSESTGLKSHPSFSCCASASRCSALFGNWYKRARNRQRRRGIHHRFFKCFSFDSRDNIGIQSINRQQVELLPCSVIWWSVLITSIINKVCVALFSDFSGIGSRKDRLSIDLPQHAAANIGSVSSLRVAIRAVSLALNAACSPYNRTQTPSDTLPARPARCLALARDMV